MEIVKVAGNGMGGMETIRLVENALVPGHAVIPDHADEVMKSSFVMVKMFVVRAVGRDDARLALAQAESGPGEDELGESADLDEQLREGVKMAHRLRRIFGNGRDDEGLSRVSGESPDKGSKLTANEGQGVRSVHIVEKS